ncbi:uncharacterized protein LOC114745031 [Neltuma alba]|nr:uncharacterized protein LOC114720709 isoform X2 [Prosopis alba]XP_028762221.1 uncharacterized protein LOC114720709 isoform X2 [Prosopis alba]XP_028789006.1 uncharacterized protein LOC114745031 [Prosopis alba]
MGFNAVYKCLQEIFPQVDARILRAVAIEHSKDVDLAAGIVLNEVIPLMSKRFIPLATPPRDKGYETVANVEAGQGNMLRHEQLVETVAAENIETASHSIEPHKGLILEVTEVPNTCNSNGSTDKFLEINESEEQYALGKVGEFLSLHVTDKVTVNATNDLKHGASTSFDHDLECADVESENLFSSGMCHEMQPAPMNDNGNGNEGNYFAIPTADNHDDITCAISHRSVNYEPSLTEGESSEVEAVDQAQRHMSNSEECSLQSELDRSTPIAAEINMESACSFSEQGCSVSKAGDVDDEIGGEDVVSQSNQVCRIDLLEEIIDEAKSNKKTLFSSMESLISLMKEVELQEKAAERAKMEAALGGSEILINVEELKNMLMHAKEANDMHAGEVYGEKAILATEMKELQSRLLSLSDEKNKSLAILDEMSKSLRVRLAAAEELRKAAEQEKLEKEESARKALAEQEAIMETVVQESTRLQLEAEENSKLREFLIDRGRVVDMLQGEISVICQDVRILKAKFDANLPLSKSFTSSQTSCILASSGSSHKSLATDAGSDHSDSSEILKTKPASSTGELSSESENKVESGKTEYKAPLDDEWDIVLEEDQELNS